jgi:hypothetical protein
MLLSSALGEQQVSLFHAQRFSMTTDAGVLSDRLGGIAAGIALMDKLGWKDFTVSYYRPISISCGLLPLVGVCAYSTNCRFIDLRKSGSSWWNVEGV